MSAQDPFYLVKEEIQDSVDRVQAGQLEYDRGGGGGRGERGESGERERQWKDLLSSCESIEWQLEELDKAIAVAERDPARFSVDGTEIERRRRWTAATHTQISLLKRSLLSSAERPSLSLSLPLSKERDRRELLRISDSSDLLGGGRGGGGGGGGPRADPSIVGENDSFIGGEDDRQALLMRQQDEHLELMSASLAKIGGLGIAIHDELGAQDKLISEINEDVVNTNTRLGIVQKKMQVILKKAGFKGQLCLIVALVVLLLILIILVFYT